LSLSADDFTFVKRHDILDYPDYLFQLDEFHRGDEKFFVPHIVFNKFSPTILKRVLREWKSFRSVVRVPLFAHNGEGDENTWKHFVSLLGFVDTGDTITFNGAPRALFIHLTNG
jgi:hypothetical protein